MNRVAFDPIKFFSQPVRQSLLNWLDAFARDEILKLKPKAEQAILDKTSQQLQINIPGLEAPKTRTLFQSVAANAGPNSLLPTYLALRNEKLADIDIPNIIPDFEQEFSQLDRQIQNQFGTWLDTIFTQVLPEDISAKEKTKIRTEALSHFPQAVRAKIRAGLYCPLPQ
ncbi:MAG: hypothetical protein LW817_01150 [Candidatus Caenarcaniphilales bacterium]|jgi:hypothetical protein|nr:hypothetical protein [Candidatus Caenarcaniphilales bacterium]